MPHMQRASFTATSSQQTCLLQSAIKPKRRGKHTVSADIGHGRQELFEKGLLKPATRSRVVPNILAPSRRCCWSWPPYSLCTSHLSMRCPTIERLIPKRKLRPCHPLLSSFVSR